MLVITHKKMSDAYFIYIISGFPEHQLSSWYGIFLELQFSNFKTVLPSKLHTIIYSYGHKGLDTP